MKRTPKIGKCKVMHYGKHNPGNKYHILDRSTGIPHELEVTKTEKDLGVHVSDTLGTKIQVDKFAAKSQLHARKDEKLNLFTTDAQKAIKNSIRQDIMRLQLCESEEIFDAVLNLFINKWRSYKSELIDNLLDFFAASGLQGNAPGVPSTTNALESWNPIIKLESTIRQRYRLSSFLTILENEIIWRWSKDRHPDDFNCDLQLYTAAFQ
ncbi:hypothetical protein BpHYR1_042747 [Brachionus plicatilis]|uniref:Uncharacterized protein n=1 Tax=Brachionus plicatilis TaxID=10195 RepID=A0A3M7PRH3_BRAPC|nr:hypothetical protein BpHYR1_042747 [Brachionus plicatilis]